MNKKIILFFLTGLFFITAHCQTIENESTLDYYNAIKSEAEPVAKEKLLLQMQAVTSDNDIRLDYCKSLVAEAYAEAGDIKKMTYWLNKIKDEKYRDSASLISVRILISAGKLSEAESILLPVLKKAENGEIEGKSGRLNRYANSLYGTILYRKGEYQKSLSYLKLSQDKPENGNEIYAQALARAGHPEAAIVEMKKVISQQVHRSDEFELIAKQLFMQVYGNDKLYRQMSDSAWVVQRRKIDEKVAAGTIEQPAPDFTITNVKGETVSLKSLKGKTIVMDFWATWCQPCVRSLPAMQKLVEYYAKDTSVVFMFIHTAERSSTATEDAKKLLAFKQLKLEPYLYMDLKDETSDNNPLLTNFGITALPTKLIIDKAGIIRFKDTGYIDEYEGVEEMKIAIDRIYLSN